MTAISTFCTAAVAAALIVSAGCTAQTVQKEPAEDISYQSTELFAQGAYRFVSEQRFSKSPEDAEPFGLEETLVVFKDGREIDRRKEWRWEVYQAEGFSKAPPSPKPGADITGDGTPDIVLMEYSGGAHCCSTYYIFELAEPLRVTKIYTGDAPLFFEQLDDSPSLEVKLFDDNFSYWRAAYANSAAPEVVLRYRDGAYQPAPDLMRGPAPSQRELEEWARQARSAGDWIMTTKPRGSDSNYDVSSDLLIPLIDLIYRGHADLVRRFTDMAWPAAKPGKAAFIEELMECRIRRSKYWPAVAAMNGLPADPSIGKCPADDEG